MNNDFLDLLIELSAANARFMIDDLIVNKRAAGRPQDLVDADELERIRSTTRTH